MAETESNNRNPRIKELSGQRFGRWTVISYAGSVDGEASWLCRCEDSTEKIVSAANLVAGHSTSCGCYQRELARARVFKHGLSTTREGKSWCNARARCCSPKNKDYPAYGGRGITMCQEWRDNFLQFLADMGPCPDGYTLDRIDPNGNYEKSNCRWYPREEQSRNQRRTINITHDGETHSLLEWSQITGILYGRLYHRYRHGEPLFAPVAPHKPYRPRKPKDR